MSRRELHQEIEQLIHSIKLHYSQINSEVRIPSIELELITSKIRKLHEKSIVYNHLHTLEEKGIILTRASVDLVFEEPEEEDNTDASAKQQDDAPSSVLPDLPTEIPSNKNNAPQLPDINAFISLNDKYMFISSLFWGNADEYRKAIQDINKCDQFASVEEVIRQLSEKFKWTPDSEVRETFLRCVKNRYL
jgi:hypothetical protein